MNPTQLATAVFTTLTPFLAAPAASAAPAAALLAALRARFAQSPDPADAAALARYEQDPTAHQAALQPRLVALLHADPAFAAQLQQLLPPPARGATFHTTASGHGHIGQVVNVDTLAGSLTLNAPTPPEAAPDALPAGLDALYSRVVSLFSLDELAELAFLLRLDPESLPGQTKPARARALLLACHRADRLPELLAHLRHARPTVTDWGAA